MPCPVAGREPTAPIYPHLLFAFAFFDILLLEIKKSVKPKGSPFLFFFLALIFFLEEKEKMTLVLACREKRGYISHSKYSFGKYTNVTILYSVRIKNLKPLNINPILARLLLVPPQSHVMSTIPPNHYLYFSHSLARLEFELS